MYRKPYITKRSALIALALSLLFPGIIADAAEKAGAANTNKTEAVLLPAGDPKSLPRRFSKAWQVMEVNGFHVGISRNGNVELSFPSGTFVVPALNMRLTSGSGIMTLIAEKYETIAGEVSDARGGRRAAITARASNGLDITLSCAVVSNTCEIVQTAKATGLLMAGSVPLYMGGITCVSSAPPRTIVSDYGETLTNASCASAKSVEFESDKKIIRIDFSGASRADISNPSTRNPRTLRVTLQPVNIGNTIPPGETVGYAIKITVRDKSR